MVKTYFVKYCKRLPRILYDTLTKMLSIFEVFHFLSYFSFYRISIKFEKCAQLWSVGPHFTLHIFINFYLEMRSRLF